MVFEDFVRYNDLGFDVSVLIHSYHSMIILVYLKFVTKKIKGNICEFYIILLQLGPRLADDGNDDDAISEDVTFS